MSTTPTSIPDVGTWEPSTVRAQPAPAQAPLSSLVASATRLTSKNLESRFQQSGGVGQRDSWQEDAWEMFDLVGELRYLTTTLAGRLSQARLYVGKIGEDPTDRPEAVEDDELNDVLDAIGGNPSSRAQLLYRMAVNLSTTGDGWLVGIPRHLLKEDGPASTAERTIDGGRGNLHLRDLEWHMLSVSEVGKHGRDGVRISLGENDDQKIVADPDDLYLIRVWRPHPRRGWEADSPTRANLPVLKELVGLTMHISAQVDSRLAGAGVFIVPESAQRALRNEDSAEEGDQFTDALIEAMVTPIRDRDSASAVVPLVVTAPDDSTDKFEYFNFSGSLDTEARNLRDEAIRRLALGQDAPPELLLGTGGMNHWGAWLVREEVVHTHLEPPLSLICDAITTQYLWPVMEEMGYSEEEIHRHVVWYDVSDLIVRPNRAEDAMALHSNGVITDDALRRETGFDETDAPQEVDPPSSQPEIQMALDMVQNNPGLLASPGLPSVVAQIRTALNDPTLSTTPIGSSGADGGDNDSDPSEPPSVDLPSREQPAGSPGGPDRPGRVQVPTQNPSAEE